ncbi:MAG: hypothetical protein HZB33_15560 [Nitrospirae bacterium]|nr:hypothetical protein [Nitrospirota bacterium]
MNVLYILKEDPDDTTQAVLAEHDKICSLTVVDIRSDRRYEDIVDLIEACDRVICW